ncbi:chaperonin 10-like protein, partial [Phyllosticta capitalensis]|uniref:chaperonin 10-like protein n=1 Tax=Phyllosticta capitalensis TaxID=121624 RepID=UPI00312F65C5
MPSKISNGPFLGLRPDPQCGREDVNGHHQLDGAANGGVNGHHHHHDKPSTPFVHDAANGNGTFNGGDEFLRLDTPKQDVLVLHGPRQKYSLERATDIPALKSDDELLIQVLAIGLNPVDWKGPDYGFGQPAYPWVNGRDFAGIVVRPPRRRSSRIQSGDVVFGPSTDYRDVRKAAYQEYVVTTDSNVARIPKGYNVKHGAALGVAFVAAAIGLGSSFGLDFGDLVADVPRGPNLHGLARAVDRSAIPEDVRAEVFEHLPYHERPQKGEWIVIWGGSSTTGIMALQLAKFAGLRVISVADVAKNGKKLLDFGADMLVDRFDQKRAAEVIRSITGDQLRFAIDVTGRESATILQDILVKSKSSLRRHLLGYTGLPKTTAPEVQHHSVPIKLFHNVPAVGESLMEWLEDLLASQTLKLPEIEVANGGLAGINAALDKMRNGAVSGKRIVV